MHTRSLEQFAASAEKAFHTVASHHTARHTGVTLMLEQGVNPRVIQTLAGWSSLRMLERYGHARDKEAQRAVGAMDALLTTLAPPVPPAVPTS